MSLFRLQFSPVLKQSLISPRMDLSGVSKALIISLLTGDCENINLLKTEKKMYSYSMP